MTFEPGPSARYMAAATEMTRGGFALFGAPYDCTASYRAGSRFAPDAIRAASHQIETYSHMLDADLEDIEFADLGDVDVPFGAPEPALEAVESATAQILAADAIPVMLGGEHSLTPACVRAVHTHHGDCVVLQLDAHADLRHEYLGSPNSHACAMRRSLDVASELIQFGIRSGTREEWDWIRAHDTLYDLDGLGRRIASLDKPIYVTVDIDGFDPSLVSGTGTPEPGGITWQEFERICGFLRDASAPVVGIDVMELAPDLDPSRVSSVVAAKVVRELMLATRA